jgi:hypothetical protein
MGMGALERWKRAVVHLEGAADSVPLEERLAGLREMTERLADPDTPGDLVLDTPPTRDIRFRGTAVIVQADDGCYLVTARHVLTDRDAAIRADITPDWVNERRSPEEREAELARWIFPIIFRVPGLDEVLARGAIEHAEFLMNLQAGVTWMSPYTFSTPEIDLAVISLLNEQRFADDLLTSGHEPIMLDDLADGPSSEGVEVFSVGYPEATAVLGEQQLHPASAHWASRAVSLPVASFGKVAMSHPALPFFWADISLYPGNSGGPVVEGDKLVGIVSSQAMWDDARIPFARVIRTAHIRPLLDEQRRKDSERRRL